jgi:hypothetical protein
VAKDTQLFTKFEALASFIDQLKIKEQPLQ